MSGRSSRISSWEKGQRNCAAEMIKNCKERQKHGRRCNYSSFPGSSLKAGGKERAIYQNFDFYWLQNVIKKFEAKWIPTLKEGHLFNPMGFGFAVPQNVCARRHCDGHLGESLRDSNSVFIQMFSFVSSNQYDRFLRDRNHAWKRLDSNALDQTKQARLTYYFIQYFERHPFPYHVVSICGFQKPERFNFNEGPQLEKPWWGEAVQMLRNITEILLSLFA